MKKLLVSVFIAATVVAAHASDTESISSTIIRIKSEIQAQMERVQRVGEITNAGITLAGVRVGEQFRIAQDDLTLQSEKLNMLRDQLMELLNEANQGGVDLSSGWKEQADQALESIRSQLSRNADLISRLQQLREDADAGLGCPFTRGTNQSVRLVWNSYSTGDGRSAVKPPEYYSRDSLLEKVAELVPPSFTGSQGESWPPVQGSPAANSVEATGGSAGRSSSR